MSDKSPIGIFDSGIGGLSTLLECQKILRHEHFIFLSDTAFLPYGNKTQEQIRARVFYCTQELVEYGCKAIVVACNTATNVGIEYLRKSFGCPFVGLEPSIRAVYGTTSAKRCLLLCTTATKNGQKFKDLFLKYGSENIIVSDQKYLASVIQNHILDKEKLRQVVGDILDNYSNIGSVVLGCTHYVFVKDIIKDYYLSKGQFVSVYDGNKGSAKELKRKLKQNGLLSYYKGRGSVKIIYTK